MRTTSSCTGGCRYSAGVSGWHILVLQRNHYYYSGIVRYPAFQKCLRSAFQSHLFYGGFLWTGVDRRSEVKGGRRPEVSGRSRSRIWSQLLFLSFSIRLWSCHLWSSWCTSSSIDGTFCLTCVMPVHPLLLGGVVVFFLCYRWVRLLAWIDGHVLLWLCTFYCRERLLFLLSFRISRPVIVLSGPVTNFVSFGVGRWRCCPVRYRPDAMLRGGGREGGGEGGMRGLVCVYFLFLHTMGIYSSSITGSTDGKNLRPWQKRLTPALDRLSTVYHNSFSRACQASCLFLNRPACWFPLTRVASFYSMNCFFLPSDADQRRASHACSR